MKALLAAGWQQPSSSTLPKRKSKTVVQWLTNLFETDEDQGNKEAATPYFIRSQSYLFPQTKPNCCSWLGEDHRLRVGWI
jgi:hypothetical protein